MSKLDMPLPQTDYQTMNCSSNEFFDIVRGLPEKTRNYVANTTRRLAEVHWITRKLDEDVRRSRPPVAQEGLLSLQIYLLLTCADTLGHTYDSGRVGQRFRAFFRNLPQEAKENLTDNILTWKTNFAEMVGLGLVDAATNAAIYPSRQQIVQSIKSLNPDERWEAVVDFLYMRRNAYTHESEYPELGYHPNLSVMQRQRLNIPNTATQRERDRLQLMFSGDDFYFTYYETNDVIATIRWSIVRGLGRVVGSI